MDHSQVGELLGHASPRDFSSAWTADAGGDVTQDVTGRDVTPGRDVLRVSCVALPSRLETYRTHSFTDLFRKSTPPQNSQLNISISNSKQQVDDFVNESTFPN